MHVAQVAPLHESVPPRLYGGTERVVSYLTEELVRQGHEVTLFASGDSRTAAELVPVCERALRLDEGCVDPLAHHVLQLERVFARAEEFDVIHFHVDYLPYPLSRRAGVPRVTTLHGRLDLPDLVPLYLAFRSEPVVSISDAQRRPLPWIGWRATVHHGLPPDLFRASAGPGRHLLFVGRISPEKGIEDAVEIAARTGRPLVVAAKVDRADRDYFEARVRPLFERSPFVDFVGEVDDAAKEELLGDAVCLLAPVRWEEPFGLVLIEALACGTPVVAYARGSIPEVVDHGVTGFVCRGLEDAVLAVERAAALPRAGVRKRFEERFTAARMASDYVRVYEGCMRGEAIHAGTELELPGPVRDPRDVPTA